MPFIKLTDVVTPDDNEDEFLELYVRTSDIHALARFADEPGATRVTILVGDNLRDIKTTMCDAASLALMIDRYEREAR